MGGTTRPGLRSLDGEIKGQPRIIAKVAKVSDRMLARSRNGSHECKSRRSQRLASVVPLARGL